MEINFYAPTYIYLFCLKGKEEILLLLVRLRESNIISDSNF